MSTSEAIPSHGLQHGQGNLPTQPLARGGGAAAATMFGRASLYPLEAESTVVAAAAAGGAGGPGAPTAGEAPAGRAARRRPRASRKAPTTLLSTDAANFRAMVQQFTGVASSGPVHVAAGYAQETVSAGVGNGGASSLALGLGHPHHLQPVAFPFGMQQQQQQRQQFPQYQQHHDITVSARWGGRGSGSGTTRDDGGFQVGYGMGGGGVPRWNMEVPDHEYLLESISSSSAASSEMSSWGSRTYDGFLL